MKTVYSLRAAAVMSVMLMAIFSCSKDDVEVSRSEAYSIAGTYMKTKFKNQGLWGDVYMSRNAVHSRTKFHVKDHTGDSYSHKTPGFSSWVVVYNAENANCVDCYLYYYVNASSGELTESGEIIHGIPYRGIKVSKYARFYGYPDVIEEIY